MLQSKKLQKKIKPLLSLLTAIIISTAVIGCSSHTAKDNSDPYQGFNETVFTFNDTVDKYALKPTAKVYNAILPQPVRNSTRNFFVNLNTLPTILSDALQGDIYYVFNDSWRFAINSTIGIGGLFDVAKHMGLEPHRNDMGLTFAKWGWKNSTFIELPFFGPSTIRDALGLPFDISFFGPWQFIHPRELRYAIGLWDIIDYRSSLLTAESIASKAALDPYIFRRNAYLQLRDAEIKANAKSMSDKIESGTAYEEDGFSDDDEDLYVQEGNGFID